MRKLFSALAMLAFLGSIAAVPAYAEKAHGGMMMGGGHSAKHKCAAGQHWVKGYSKKNGQKVKGYCR